LYYVTAECQLRCLDTQGFGDGENNGPYREEVFQDNAAADIIWELDTCGRLGVFPHEATNSEVLPLGDLLMVSTSNGQNEGHTLVPSPRAPSLIAVDKHSGEVVWRAIGAGEHVLHGQWSSPVAANVNGRMQVLFGGGDGWLRAYDAASGHEIWRFDGNPKDARWLPRPGVLSRSFILASPVFANGLVFVAMGQSPGHGNGPSFIHAISQLLGQIEMDAALYSPPALVGDALYLATANRLYLIAAKL
jgi:outer membrane protein assembly factor BamB